MKAQLPFLYDMRMFAKDQTRETPESDQLVGESRDHLEMLEKLRGQLLQIDQLLNRKDPSRD
jgi:hypothetical protein